MGSHKVLCKNQVKTGLDFLFFFQCKGMKHGKCFGFMWTQLSGNVMNCQIPELFSGTESNPHFTSINVGHFGDRENNNICVDGSNQDFAISAM